MNFMFFFLESWSFLVQKQEVFFELVPAQLFLLLYPFKKIYFYLYISVWINLLKNLLMFLFLSNDEFKFQLTRMVIVFMNFLKNVLFFYFF